ncbi:hypothetical protein, partial [Candidatus Vampirococcus lugosii]
RQTLTENTYFMLERLNAVVSDFTIDYEEYFNRSIVGCSGGGGGGDSFVWTGSPNGVNSEGYCDNFTAYGNKNWQTGVDGNNWQLYHCSSINTTVPDPNKIYRGKKDDLSEWSSSDGIEDRNGCWNDTDLVGKPQSYGQYARQFMDVGDNVSGTGGAVGDDDDLDLGHGPDSLFKNKNVQEIYLKNKAGDQRILIRRALVGTGDRNNSGSIDDDTNKLYTLQMLRLRGFDAGKKHDFDLNSPGMYDGQIDTWACDYGLGFKCSGDSVGGAYSDYKLPDDKDDGWVNIFSNEITITDWNLAIYPSKNPNLSWNEDGTQINPYIKLNIEAKLYGGAWAGRVNSDTLKKYQINLQTMFNVRSNY